MGLIHLRSYAEVPVDVTLILRQGETEAHYETRLVAPEESVRMEGGPLTPGDYLLVVRTDMFMKERLVRLDEHSKGVTVAILRDGSASIDPGV